MTTSTPYSPFPPSLSAPSDIPAPPKGWPSKQQLLATLPADLTDKNVAKAWSTLAFSLSTSLLAYGAGCFIPLQWSLLPVWLAYAVVAGTLAGGCWVLAHECGHNAFHPNPTIENGVGLVLHSLLLVPYFSWQRSHAVHHSHCNHLEAGETHVPSEGKSSWGIFTMDLKRILGVPVYGAISILVHLLLGWPLYLIFGITGGPEHGFPTSHFVDFPPFNSGRRQLFPGKWKGLMQISNLGLLFVIALLVVWASQTSILRVLCVYGLPYLVINAWLVAYTWMQHTDPQIPHFSSADWDWAKGALQTVDRPYGPLLNLLHHGIGSTHVVHHLNPRIPHYNAWRATEILRNAFPDHVRVDATPIHQALWKVGCRCSYVSRKDQDGGYYYT